MSPQPVSPTSEKPNAIAMLIAATLLLLLMYAAMSTYEPRPNETLIDIGVLSGVATLFGLPAASLLWSAFRAWFPVPFERERRFSLCAACGFAEPPLPCACGHDNTKALWQHDAANESQPWMAAGVFVFGLIIVVLGVFIAFAGNAAGLFANVLFGSLGLLVAGGGVLFAFGGCVIFNALRLNHQQWQLTQRTSGPRVSFEARAHLTTERAGVVVSGGGTASEWRVITGTAYVANTDLEPIYVVLAFLYSLKLARVNATRRIEWKYTRGTRTHTSTCEVFVELQDPFGVAMPREIELAWPWLSDDFLPTQQVLSALKEFQDPRLTLLAEQLRHNASHDPERLRAFCSGLDDALRPTWLFHEPVKLLAMDRADSALADEPLN